MSQTQAFQELKEALDEKFATLTEAFDGQPQAQPKPRRSPTAGGLVNNDEMDVEKLDLIEGHLDTIRVDFDRNGRYDFAEMREVLGRIENGVHDIKLYHAPPVDDPANAMKDGTVTRYQIGDHVLPLSTVQEIVALNLALKDDLIRSGNNLDVAKFYMAIVRG